MCIEKVVIRKSGEDLYNKSYQSPIAPQRIVLKPNLHYGRQDTTSSDVRTSFDHSDKHEEDWTVERARKLVAVKKTSGSKDCPIRLSKNTITSAKRQSRN